MSENKNNNLDEFIKENMDVLQKIDEDDYKWAIEELAKYDDAQKIELARLEDPTFCGFDTIYSKRGIVIFYNEKDECIATHILFIQRKNETSLYEIVHEHQSNADFDNGWYNELCYAKFVAYPYADPMDLIILSIQFSKILKPKYKKH